MSEDRLTPLQLLEARLATMEEQIERLEGWTGFDEEEYLDGDVPSLDERLSVQELIIRHMLTLIEKQVPGFSVESFAGSLKAALAIKIAESGDDAVNAEIEQRLGRIIDDVIQVSPQKEKPSKIGKSHLLLVGKNRDQPAQEP
ncbi:hypothetical protein [Brucella anthropi]|uniref:hypothetical protein n=1 Tax=Brucella anthropi TaxID=529 RepID=UPI0009B82FB3|nr:hypothetical protein [Brucella anthropi]